MQAWAAYYVEVGQCTEAEAADWVAGLVAQAEAAGAHAPPADPSPVADPASEDAPAAGAEPVAATGPAAEEAVGDAAAESGPAASEQLPGAGVAGMAEAPGAAVPETAPADVGTADDVGSGSALASAGGPAVAADAAPAAAAPPTERLPMEVTDEGGDATASAQPSAFAAEPESNGSCSDALGVRGAGSLAGGLDAAASSSSLGEWAAATKRAQPNFGKLAGARPACSLPGWLDWRQEEDRITAC